MEAPLPYTPPAPPVLVSAAEDAENAPSGNLGFDGTTLYSSFA